MDFYESSDLDDSTRHLNCVNLDFFDFEIIYNMNSYFVMVVKM